MLGIVALMLNLAGRGMLEKGHRLKAQRIAAAQGQPSQEETRLIAETRVFNRLGLVSTLFCAASLGAAAVRRESGWYLIMIMLLLCNVMLHMFP